MIPQPSEPIPPPSVPVRRRGTWPIWSGAVIAVLSLAALAVCVAQLAVGAAGSVSDALTSPVLSVPGTRTLRLERSEYAVYELNGSQTRRGDVTAVQRHSITITPDQVTVTGPDGTPLPLGGPGGGSQNITRGEQIFTAAVFFDVPAAGDYRVAITPDQAGQVIVAKTLGAAFAGKGRWAIGLLASIPGILIGIVLLIVGVVLRYRSRPGRVVVAPVQAWPGPPAPGWYPDRTAAGRSRYWDGRQWTDHTR